MTDRAQQAADTLAALTSPTARQVRQTLDEFDAKDQAAALAATGGGGGIEVLEDPGNTWQPSTAVAQGHRFAETVEGELRVFEVTVAGTTGTGVFTDYGTPDLVPLESWATGTETFIYIGIVGQVSWHEAPFLGGGLAVGPVQGSGGHELLYTITSEPADAENLVALRGTLAGSPVSVLEVQTDGDGDYVFEEGNAPSLRFSNRGTGTSLPRIELSYEGFTVAASGGSLVVTYSPFAIRMTGLATSDPGVAGRLWNDAGTLKISAG